MAKANLSAQRLRELLHYDPATGVFARRTDARRWKAGQQVGSLNKTLGYIVISIDRQWNWAHRLAWLYMTGEHPTGSVDHINGTRHDNRWSNLRNVTQSVNLQNRKGPQRDNRLGVLGVSMRRGRYRATIKVNRKQTHLGDFDTVDEAQAAYLTAKRALHAGNTL